MSNAVTAPTTEDFELAEKVAEWMTSLPERQDANDYLHNLGVLGSLGFVPYRQIGLAVSAVSAYQRENAEKVAKEHKGPSVSLQIGTVGERLVRKVRFLRLHTTDGQYGTTYIQTFEVVSPESEAGASVVWFGSSLLKDEAGQPLKVGDEVWVKGTVKGHKQYRDVWQTTLSRVALAPEPKAPKAPKAPKR
jgi:hypothetical protein